MELHGNYRIFNISYPKILLCYGYFWECFLLTSKLQIHCCEEMMLMLLETLVSILNFTYLCNRLSLKLCYSSCSPNMTSLAHELSAHSSETRRIPRDSSTAPVITHYLKRPLNGYYEMLQDRVVRKLIALIFPHPVFKE